MCTLTSNQTIRQSLRAHVCVACDDRPEGSATWRSNIQRPCEDQCTIFGNLHRLEQLVSNAEGDPHVDLHQEVREAICLNCHSCKSEGRLGERDANCTCPLKMNQDKVTGLLQTLLMPVSGSD
ncbi:hypothetical protein BH10PLA1_BH10PLA1_07590 [soil metagenome]